MRVIYFDSRVQEEIKTRLIKEFLDILILRRVMEAPSSGHDIMKYIIRNYGIYLSPGIVYSTLYSLERRELVEARPQTKKRIYMINEKGEELLREYQDSLDELVDFTMKFFEGLLSPIKERRVLIERKRYGESESQLSIKA